MPKRYIHKSRGAINANVFFNKCLRPNLVQFIKENYNDDNHIFWPDFERESSLRNSHHRVLGIPKHQVGANVR